MQKKVKLIIFDLDGTLADTIDAIREAVNDTLCRFGFPNVEREDVLAGINHGPRWLCRAMLPERFRADEEMVDRVLEYYHGAYAKTFDHTKETYDGIKETIAELKSRGYLLAVLSNKQDAYVRHLCASLFPENTFSAVSGSLPDLTKPDAALTLHLMKQAAPDLTPDECAFVGDSDVDIRTAENAKMLSVGVAWGYRGRDFLAQNRADIIIDRPAELLDIFC